MATALVKITLCIAISSPYDCVILLSQSAQDELVFPLSFKWEKQSNLPYGVNLENLCIIKGKLYNSIYEDSDLLVYTPETGTWVELPTPTKYHGVLSLNGKLTLVGGLMKKSEQYSREIRVWDGDSKQWMEPYPPMTMGHRDVGCASYQHYLIVAGGNLAGQVQSTASVEILDTKSGQWFKAPPMPYNGANIHSVIIGHSLYFLFTFRSVLFSKSLLRVSLPTLISHTLQGKNRDTSIWEKMPDVPLYNMALFSIGNMLLTAGGSYGGTVGSMLTFINLKQEKQSADIHLFNPHTNQWLKIGELPEPRAVCACTVLPSGKLLVAGGQGMGKDNLLSTVYTATIAGSYCELLHS